MDEVERRVTAWLGKKHALPGTLTDLLRKSIAGEQQPDASLLADVSEALEDLERIQSGMHF